jgi:hypothetical protein
MKFRYVLLLFVSMLGVQGSFAQSKSQVIAGRVVSFEESLPLEGVTIKIKDSQTITGTQADGSFSLPLKPQEKVLLISLEGYETRELTVTKATDYNIVLRRRNN